MIPEQTLEALTNGFGHMGSASVDLKTAHTDTLSASVDPAESASNGMASATRMTDGWTNGLSPTNPSRRAGAKVRTQAREKPPE